MRIRTLALLMLLIVGIAAMGLAQEATVDGKISAGEYRNLYYSNPIQMSLYWTIIGDTIYIGLRAPAEGWLAINLMAMMGGDIHGDTIIGFVNPGLFNDTLSLADQVAPEDGHFPHMDDTERGGEDNILDKDGTQNDGVTVIEFSRKLNTGDANDIALMDDGMGTMIMLAYSPDADDYQTYHGAMERIALTVDFFNGFVNDFPTGESHTGS
ncbi:DOMON domain-containing protein [Candidatus Bipolaricaulota bacterium]